MDIVELIREHKEKVDTILGWTFCFILMAILFFMPLFAYLFWSNFRILSWVCVLLWVGLLYFRDRVCYE